MADQKFLNRNLKDLPFSLDRLFVWAVGIVLVTGAVTMALLAYQQKPIAPQIQSLTMVALGAFVGRIESKRLNEKH